MSYTAWHLEATRRSRTRREYEREAEQSARQAARRPGGRSADPGPEGPAGARSRRERDRRPRRPVRHPAGGAHRRPGERGAGRAPPARAGASPRPTSSPPRPPRSRSPSRLPARRSRSTIKPTKVGDLLVGVDGRLGFAGRATIANEAPPATKQAEWATARTAELAKATLAAATPAAGSGGGVELDLGGEKLVLELAAPGAPKSPLQVSSDFLGERQDARLRHVRASTGYERDARRHGFHRRAGDEEQDARGRRPEARTTPP